jgi:hypothetical protein
MNFEIESVVLGKDLSNCSQKIYFIFKISLEKHAIVLLFEERNIKSRFFESPKMDSFESSNKKFTNTFNYEMGQKILCSCSELLRKIVVFCPIYWKQKQDTPLTILKRFLYFFNFF